MTLAEIHGLIASNRELIANTWNFFLSVHLAIFGLLLLPGGGGRGLFGRLLLLCPGYAGFMYFNYRAQQDNYQYSKSLLDFAAKLEETAATPMALTSAFKAGWMVQYLDAIYLGTGALTFVIVLMFAVFGGKRKATQDQ